MNRYIQRHVRFDPGTGIPLPVEGDFAALAAELVKSTKGQSIQLTGPHGLMTGRRRSRSGIGNSCLSCTAVERRDRNTLSVYPLLRDDHGLGLTAGDLLVGRREYGTTNYLTLVYRLSNSTVPEYGSPANAVTWVG